MWRESRTYTCLEAIANPGGTGVPNLRLQTLHPHSQSADSCCPKLTRRRLALRTLWTSSVLTSTVTIALGSPATSQAVKTPGILDTTRYSILPYDRFFENKNQRRFQSLNSVLLPLPPPNHLPSSSRMQYPPRQKRRSCNERPMKWSSLS